tara:strand:+ start:37 stop:264 length:228 start_codon:yes stop_codon:yes gene_type:complete
MKVILTYTVEVEQTENNVLGYKKVTNQFTVAEKINNAYLLKNGWFVDYKYSVNSEWEIFKGEEYISLCPKPIEIK